MIHRLSVLPLAFAAALASPAQTPTGYAVHQTITFSGYTGSAALANFPVLLKLKASEFGTAAKNDLAIVDAEGTRLPFEIDSCTDSDVLVWVKIPSLTAETAVTAYFGKAEPDAVDFAVADVWTNAYAAVWHMNADATDATGHGLTQLAYNASRLTATSGTLGRAFKLAANTDSGLWLETPKASFVDTVVTDGEKLTVSGWLKPSAVKPGMANRLFCWKANTEYSGFDTFQNTDGKFYVRGNTKSSTWKTAAALPWKANAWSHLAVRLDSMNAAFAAFCNGASLAADSSSKTSALNLKTADGRNTQMFGYGNVGGYKDDETGTLTYATDFQYPFANGELDEMRIYNGLASDDWIKAESDTVQSDAFAAYGDIVYDQEGEDVDGTWISTAATANWSDTANWQDGIVPSGAGPTVTFAGGAVGQTIVLPGEVKLAALVQSDGATRTLAGGTFKFKNAADVTVTAGKLTLAENLAATAGLEKKGAGTLDCARGLTVTGDATVSAGTLALSGGASAVVSESPYSPTGDRLVTHLGLSAFDPEKTAAARVSLRENGTIVQQVRFTAKMPGFEKDGVRFLRLPFAATLAAGKTYTLETTNGATGEMLVADAATANDVRGTLTLAEGATLALASAVLTAQGLTGAGTIAATEPAEIDLSLASAMTFAGATSGRLGLVKREAPAFTLTGTGVFADGITCRGGTVHASDEMTLDPLAPLVFGDTTGANACGKFTIDADGATLVNPIAVTLMTTTGLTAHGVYAQGGNALTLEGVEIDDCDKQVWVKDWKPGQFALHAHANAAGDDPTLTVKDSSIEYLDFTARVDGDAARATTRPDNKIVFDNLTAPNKVRKLTVQNSVQNALGGTVELTAAAPLVTDYLDIVGAQSKFVMASGARLDVVTGLRFTDSTLSWETVTASDVDWTIGPGAVLAANGFPTYFNSAGKSQASALRFDGGTLKTYSYAEAADDDGNVIPVSIFPLGSALGVTVTERGGTIDVVGKSDARAARVVVAAPISGAGGMTFRGDATLPTVQLDGAMAYAGATTAERVTLVVTNGTQSLAALDSAGGALDVAKGATVTVGRLTGDGIAKSGEGTLALTPAFGADTASSGTVTVSDGTLALACAKTVETVDLGDDGRFEPATPITSGDVANHDRRCTRDSGYFAGNLTSWTFGSSPCDNGSGICCDASYFSNDRQISGNGANNSHAAFLRKTSSAGAGTISRTVTTAHANAQVTVGFQYNARWYNRNTWYGRVGVQFDGELVYSSDVVRLDTDSTSDDVLGWRDGLVMIDVAAAGEHTLAFTALDIPAELAADGQAHDCEALLDNVTVGIVYVDNADQQTRLGDLRLDLAEGTRLDLDADISVRLQSVRYAGEKVSGTISAATHPEFVTGAGSLTTPAGLVFIVR